MFASLQIYNWNDWNDWKTELVPDCPNHIS
ncbi:Uncharacterised protein [Chlamydia abortus]|nr:Uncharacterised protein [Chlamydia abortus]